MSTQRPLPDLEGVSHEYVDLPGLRMHVAVAGPADAEPLVLLHGWPQHWYAWRRLIGPLSEHYRVYCPDLRGFGWSDAPAGSYLKAQLAADVIALLDALGLDRVRLAGHDWGGFTGFLALHRDTRSGSRISPRRGSAIRGSSRDRRRGDGVKRSGASPTWG